MTEEKKEKLGVKTNKRPSKSKTSSQRAKKTLSATVLCILDLEENLSGSQLELVPYDVQKWLIGTFTNKTEVCKIKHDDNAKPRLITQAVESSTHVIRRFRTSTSSAGIAYPEEVIAAFQDVDKWSFNVFVLNEVSLGYSLKYMMCEMFNKYDLLTRFQIPLTTLISFAEALELGYAKYRNPYHNAIHAADVTQTVHSILLHTGIMHWLTDLEILAIFFSTSVHDYEHTGTTNNFHIQTRSEVALLYNDTSVLENHHLSAAYQLLQNPELNILENLTEEEWREMRHLVIKIVLSTDMSSHFQDMKHTVQGLQHHERLDKTMVMCMVIHVADISHPAKQWDLHHHWSEALFQEFFKQGAKEAELGLPISPLCDREATNIAESQIGFINIIVKPIFTLMFDVVQKIVLPLLQKAADAEKPWKSKGASVSQSTQIGNRFMGERGPCTGIYTLSRLDVPNFRYTVMSNIHENRSKWKDALEPKKKESPEKESNRAKDHVSEDKAQKEKSRKDHVSEDKAQKEKPRKDHVSEDKAQKEKSQKDQASEDKAQKEKSQKDQASEDKAQKEKSQKDHTSEDKAQKEKSQKDHASEDKAQKEKSQKDHASEDKACKEKSRKRTTSLSAQSKSKKYCTLPQTTATCDCQLCDCKAFEPMDVKCIAYNACSSAVGLPRQDSDAMEVTESYEEIVDKESSWRKTAGQTLESNIQEMRTLVPKTKPLSANESDDVIIEEFIPDDPQPELMITSEPPATSGQERALNAPNVGFIMTDLTQSDMEIFSLWNEQIMRQAAEQQKPGPSRMLEDTPLQVAVPARPPVGCQGCEGASAGMPPQSFVLQVISFDSPSVTCSEDAVLNCEPGPPAALYAPTSDMSILPANAAQQNQTEPCGAAAVSVTSLSYGVFKMPQ